MSNAKEIAASGDTASEWAAAINPTAAAVREVEEVVFDIASELGIEDETKALYYSTAWGWRTGSTIATAGNVIGGPFLQLAMSATSIGMAVGIITGIISIFGDDEEDEAAARRERARERRRRAEAKLYQRLTLREFAAEQRSTSIASLVKTEVPVGTQAKIAALFERADLILSPAAKVIFTSQANVSRWTSVLDMKVREQKHYTEKLAEAQKIEGSLASAANSLSSIYRSILTDRTEDIARLKKLVSNELAMQRMMLRVQPSAVVRQFAAARRAHQTRKLLLTGFGGAAGYYAGKSLGKGKVAWSVGGLAFGAGLSYWLGSR